MCSWKTEESSLAPSKNQSMNSAKLNKIILVASIIVIVAALASLSPKISHALRAARAPKIEGAWQGTLQIQQASLRGVLKIAKTHGDYHAAFDSIDQRLTDIPVSKFVYDYPMVRAELSSLGATYEAKVDSAGRQMSGDWKQRGVNVPLTLERTATPYQMAEPMAESDYQAGSGAQGAWQGTLQAGPMSLRLRFRIGANADGAWRAEMDSVDQGVTALAASSASFNAPTVKMNFNQIGGAFQGDLNADQSQLAGTWTQGGQTFPLKLERPKPEAAPAPESEADYSYASPAELQGHWRGTLAIQTVKLRIVFNIAKKPDATYTATLDSPDQGGGHVPSSSVKFDAPKAHLEWNGIAASYDGELKDGKLDGTFTQGGARIPLALQRDTAQ